MGHLRELVAGQFDGHRIYVNDLATDNLSNVAKAARALHCSADYIVGLTEELTVPTLPEGQLMIAGWMPGSTTPAEPGEFAVYIDLDGKLIPQFFRWTGSRWEMRTGTVPQVPVVWWMRLPPVPSDKKGADT